MSLIGRPMAHFLHNGNSSSHLSLKSVQPMPNSIFKNISAEALETNAFQQRPLVVLNRGTRAQLLSGWKEIANYMHQGVRTVQRWEAIGLPVRRVTKSKRSPVIALAEDLDVWSRSLHVPLLERIEELSATISALEAQIVSLKRELSVRKSVTQIDKTRSPAFMPLPQDCASGVPPRSRSNDCSRSSQ